jgi:hypothetical protein
MLAGGGGSPDELSEDLKDGLGMAGRAWGHELEAERGTIAPGRESMVGLGERKKV